MKRTLVWLTPVVALLGVACGQSSEECFEDKADERCAHLTDPYALDMCLADVYEYCVQQGDF